jgi:hypothetical protein
MSDRKAGRLYYEGREGRRVGNCYTAFSIVVIEAFMKGYLYFYVGMERFARFTYEGLRWQVGATWLTRRQETQKL